MDSFYRTACVLLAPAVFSGIREVAAVFMSDTYSGCFACGADNPIGLKLVFTPVGEGRVECSFTPDKVHQGYEGILHGGLAATLLDEGMAWAVMNYGHKGATAKMELRWRKPIPIGRPLTIEGEVLFTRGKACEARAFIRFEDGTVAAEAKGVFIDIA